MSNDPGALSQRPFVMVGPKGVAHVGIHKDEADCWRVALGWPTAEEIRHAQAKGFAVYPATLTWTVPRPSASALATTQEPSA